MTKDLGDFQTPPELAVALIQRLGPIGARWSRVLEPTCGRGGFLEGLLNSPSPPSEMIGIELQASHCAEARAALDRRPSSDCRTSILQADVFNLDLGRDLTWTERGPLLVLGNPPWVTNAELGRLGSTNLPPKRNVKKLNGLDARTGSANFDLGEAVWLKLIAELADQGPTLALLCKTSVARSILHQIHRTRIAATEVEMIEIDARRWFRASVGACFLKMTLGTSEAAGAARVSVFAGPESASPYRTMGSVQGVFASDFDVAQSYGFAIGNFPAQWRQGVKHDAAPVMELIRDGDDGPLRNGLGEVVDVEASRVYPLVKGADLGRADSERPRRAMIVTQEKLGADTRVYETLAPKLWSYLQAHATWFDKRRSSIYKTQPPFSLFGIGPYTFAPYKVVVAGLHRPTRFRAIGSVAGRPTVLDDTCYLLPCESAHEAAVITAVCNDPITLGVLGALTFADAKRPVTKAVLQKIDLGAVIKHAERLALVQRAFEVLRDDLNEAETDDPFAAIEAEIDRLSPLLSPIKVGKLEPTAQDASTVERRSTSSDRRA